MTFSIVGRCARTGMFGVAISSSSPAVAARCAYARSGVGAVATQNVTDPRLGPAGLNSLEGGCSASDALDSLIVRAGADRVYRQIAIVDRDGRTAAYTGDRALGVSAHRESHDVVAAGNLLFSRDVPKVMIDRFNDCRDSSLAERLLLALEAAVDCGGEAGPLFSAGMLVYDRVEWAVVDLRVDYTPHPVSALRELWGVWQHQLNDYMQRAISPSSAPSYGVDGEIAP